MSGRHIGIRLGFVFGILLIVLIGVGTLGLIRMGRIHTEMETKVYQRWATIKLSREALEHSMRNHRIVIQIFLLTDKEEVNRRLAQRAANSEKISSLIAQIEPNLRTQQEKALLEEIKLTRKVYIESYKEALNLLVEQHEFERAREILSNKTVPLLTSYHEAWNNLFEFEGQAVDRAVHEAAAGHALARKVAIFLTVIAVLLTAALAISVTRAMIRDISGREKAEGKLRDAYERLRSSERRYRQLADAMPEIVWTAEPDGSVKYFNQKWFDYTGLTDSHTGAFNWGAVVHPEDLKAGLSCWTESLRSGKKYEFEYRLRSCDNEYRWHLVRGVPGRDADGKIVRWYGTCTDIDDQKRSEGALRNAREALEERVAHRTAELLQANDGLRIEIGERKTIEAERSVLFEIIQGVNTTQNLDELLGLAHHAIRKILYAENCFIALFDKRTGLFDMEFFVDEHDSRPAPQKLTRSRTAYVFRTGRPTIITREDFEQLVHDGEIEDVGTPPASWLGVPLGTPTERLGVLVVQHYELEDAYSQRDLEFLTSVGGQIAFAIARKRGEEALRLSEERHRELFENAKDAMYVHDLDGRYTSVNRAAEEMVSCKREEILGKTIADFISPETLQKIQKNLSARVNLPEQTGYEMELLARDGRRLDIEVSSRLIYENGVAVAVQGSARDITERKRIEESLRQSDRLMAQLLDAMPVGVFVIDANGRPYFSNQVAEQIHGKGVVNDITFEQLAETYSSYLTNSDQICPTEELPIVQALRGKTVIASSLEIRRSDRVVPIEVWATPIYDAHGSIAYALAAFADVTQRRLIEMELAEARDAAVESARLKSEFLANMSHEIRTPMNGVVGMTALLLDTDLDHEQRECAETIRSSGDSLLTIINDILDFSKIEAGKLQFEHIAFDLANTLESTVEALAARAREKRLELASLIYSDVPTALNGDAGRLRQVLTNLIGNALKFTERGEVILRAETESVSDVEAVIRFSVTDTGIGISEDAQRNLFRAFTQADGSTTRKYGGTGLGLAISKQLVNLMGGTMGVTSKPGEGSTFWFTARFDRQPLTDISTGRAGACLERLRALVVDDNATNRKIVSHQLNSWRMIHSEAESGKQALQMLRSAISQDEGFDIAILDLMMPEMDGFELARTIKADPQLNNTRLVLLTSSGRQGESIIAQDVGIAGYLTKPVRQSQLFDCLASVVGNRDESLRPDANTSKSTPRTQETPVRYNEKLILLAEDNIVNRKVALRQLQRLGYRADAVTNGREAVDAVLSKSYDLVLMDCQMPEMDGYEATAEIRRREGDAKHTFIVAMTANALKGDRERCLAAGMDEYISKPVQSEILKNILESVFNGGVNSVTADCPVNLKHLHEAMGTDPEEVQELVELYLEQMTHKLERLSEAIQTENASGIELIAHNCAGVSANCGIVNIVGPLRELERMGREKTLEGAASLGVQVSREFERASRYLRDTLTSVTV